MSNRRVFLTEGLLAVVLALAAGPQLGAQDGPVTFRATAVNTSDVGRQGMDTLDIAIERWTSDEEFAKLKDALVEKGSDSLLREFSNVKPRVGYIRRTGGGLGWDLRYARKAEIPGGGYRVLFATDRPMSFTERSTNPRSAEYEFLLGEIRIGRDGKGEGKLVPMASVEYDEESRSIQIENYATEPVRLTQVTEEKRRASAPASR
jgi:hypothetical protein